MQSTNKLSVFAAASLYTGKFQGLSGMSANMEFGQPFTSRPIALHGYYQYTPQKINHVDRTPDGVTITNGETMDECSIFIALAKKSFGSVTSPCSTKYWHQERLLSPVIKVLSRSKT